MKKQNGDSKRETPKNSYFPILINLHYGETGKGIRLCKNTSSLPRCKPFKVLLTNANERDLRVALLVSKEMVDYIK